MRVAKNEIRVGLVLYGGVSLATYIFGVVYEFLRAARASLGLEKNSYSCMLDETKSGVTVDIISGTSAGGINGVLLAKALCNGLSIDSFKKVRDVWLNAGDFSSLLKPGRKEMAALLNEEFFEDQLRKALEQMDDDVKEAEKVQLLTPAVSALDLFITSTDLTGRVLSGRELVEVRGNRKEQSIETKEYRRVFHLKFRTKGYNPVNKELGYPWNDLAPDKKKNQRLVVLCRATSAFPVAFRPAKMSKDNEITADLLEPGDNKTVYLTDGGLLNNKPFSSTIAAIFQRAAFGKVDRMLFYVEPDPEVFSKPSADDLDEPTFWHIIGKTVSIPAYQSILEDMRNVRERNSRIERFNEVLHRTEKLIRDARDSQGGLVRDMVEDDYRSYLKEQTLFEGYQDLKVTQLRQYLREQCMAQSLELHKRNSEMASIVKKTFDEVLEEIEGRGRKEFLQAFDTPFRLRRFFRLIEETELIYQGEDEQLQAVSQVLQNLWALLHEARDIEWRAWNTTDEEPRSWFQGELTGLKDKLAAMDRKPVKSDEDWLKKELGDLMDKMLKKLHDELEASLKDKWNKLVPEIGKQLQAYEPSFGETLKEVYDRFEFRDMFIYPLEVVGNLGERDHIDVVRISPKDAKCLGIDSEKKLAGEGLLHFAGFLKKEWRQNDIMWGRLDAAELIVQNVCDKFSSSLTGNEAVEFKKKVGDFKRKALEEVFIDERSKDAEPVRDFRDYLKEKHKVGEEGLSDIDADRRAILVMKVLSSFKDMLKYAQSKKLGNLMGFFNNALLKVTKILNPLVTLFVKTLFDRDPLVRKVFRYLFTGVGIWGAANLAIFILGRVLNVSWLSISWPLVGLSLAAVVILLIFAYLSRKFSVKDRPD